MLGVRFYQVCLGSRFGLRVLGRFSTRFACVSLVCVGVVTEWVM